MAISKKTSRVQNKNSEASHTIFETAPKAALIMLFTGLFILLIATILAHNLSSPAAYSMPLAFVSLILGAAIGGFFCSKQLETKNALIGASLASLLLIVLLTATRLFIPFTVQSSGVTFTVIGYASVVLSSVAGVFSGKQMPQKKKRRKKHYRS